MTSDVGVAFNPKSAIQNPKSEEWSVASESGKSGESLQEECTAPEKVPNEANLGSTQSSMPIDVQLFAIDPQGGKRSQSGAGRTVGLDAWKDPFEPIAPGSGG